MGCDIHMWAEVKVGYSGKHPDEWKTVGTIFPNTWALEDSLPVVTWYPGDEDEDEYVREFYSPLTIHPYDNRNYEVFSILADVRNRYGIKPILEPRGLPEDINGYTKKQMSDYYHSISWLTLDELENYDWDQEYVHTGVVDLKQYLVFKKNGSPDSWSGGVWGGMVQHITNEEADILSKNLDLVDIKDWNTTTHYYTTVEWTESYRESASDFLEAMDRLKELGKHKNVKDVRIIFGFDS